jgi:hypothetical protein
MNNVISFRVIHVEEDVKNKVKLIFTNLSEENSGTYTCKVTFNDMTPDIKKKLDLKVSSKCVQPNNNFSFV